MSTDDWLPITDIAKRLTDAGDPVERSTLSRYIDKWGIEKRKDGRTAKASFSAVQQHRIQNMRLDQSPVVAAPERGSSEPSNKQVLTGSQRKALASAEREEMALAKDRGQLVPATEVDKAIRDAVALMHSAFEKSVETVAADAALKYGWNERQIRQVLKEYRAVGTDALHREVLKIMQNDSQKTEGDLAYVSRVPDRVLQ